MIKNSYLKMLTTAALLSGMEQSMQENKPSPRKVKVEVRPNFTSKLTKDSLAARKGLKPFRYGDHVIYAINRKNAYRKARKQNLI